MFAGKGDIGRHAPQRNHSRARLSAKIKLFITALIVMLVASISWQAYIALGSPALFKPRAGPNAAQVIITSRDMPSHKIDSQFVRKQRALALSRSVTDRVIDTPSLNAEIAARLVVQVSAGNAVDLREAIRTYVLSRVKIDASLQPAQLTFNVRSNANPSEQDFARQLSSAFAQSYTEVLNLGGPAQTKELRLANLSGEPVVRTGAGGGWLLLVLGLLLLATLTLLAKMLYRLWPTRNDFASRAQRPMRSQRRVQTLDAKIPFPPKRSLSAGLPPRRSVPARNITLPKAKPDFRQFALHSPKPKHSPKPMRQTKETPIAQTDFDISDSIVDRLIEIDETGLVLFVDANHADQHQNAHEVTTIDNLVAVAHDLKQCGISAVIVDATWAPDLRDPQMLGLSDLIEGQADFGEVLHCDEETGISFVPRGAQTIHAHASPALSDLRDAMLSLFDLVLVHIGDTHALSLLTAFAHPEAQIMLLNPPRNRDVRQIEADTWFDAGFDIVHLIDAQQSYYAEKFIDQHQGRQTHG